MYVVKSKTADRFITNDPSSGYYYLSTNEGIQHAVFRPTLERAEELRAYCSGSIIPELIICKVNLEPVG